MAYGLGLYYGKIFANWYLAVTDILLWFIHLKAAEPVCFDVKIISIYLFA